jgi:hypothetical protein
MIDLERPIVEFLGKLAVFALSACSSPILPDERCFHAVSGRSGADAFLPFGGQLPTGLGFEDREQVTRRAERKEFSIMRGFDREKAMPSERKPSLLRSTAVRLLVVALGLTLLILAAMLVPPWFRATVPEREIRRVSQALLLAAQPAYGVALGIIMLGLVALGLRLARARRRGQARPWTARMGLLLGSLLLAVLIAEGVAGVWRARAHRLPSFPDLPTRFDDRENGELNVVVLGGSYAYGLPFEKWLSTGHIVAWKLGQALPDRHVRLDVLAEPGVHLEKMHQKLAAYRRHPDLVIIFSGHNEFTYRFRWSRSVDHYLDEAPARPRRLLKELAAACSPLCGVIQDAIEANGLGEPPPPEVTRQLVDVPVCTPEEYSARLDDFRRRLEVIVAHCEQTGTLAVLLIPPGNDSGFEPNRSILPPATSRAAREEFARRFMNTRATEETDAAKAIAYYRTMVAEQPGFAEAHFRLGRLLERAGDWAEANRHYIAARDHDALPMRCNGDFHEIYREVAARHPRALLVDGQAALSASSAGHILGDQLFLDAMHPTVRGHALLAQAVLNGLRERRAFGWPEGSTTPVVDLAECASHFGVGAEAWKVACDWGAKFFELTAHIRYDPAERLAWITRYRGASKKIAEGRDAEDVGLPGIGVRTSAAAGDGALRQTSIGPKRASGQ